MEMAFFLPLFVVAFPIAWAGVAYLISTIGPVEFPCAALPSR